MDLTKMSQTDTLFEEKTKKTYCLIITISPWRGRSRACLDVGVLGQVNSLGLLGEA